MKKYILPLFVFSLFITLLGFNVNVASADFTPGCTSDSQIYSLTTGQLCNTVSLTQNLQIGSRGSEVTILQTFLKTEGYFFGRVDGRYGRITARAVGDFQEDVDLSRTERADAPTRAKINAFIAAGEIFDNTNTTSTLPEGCTSTQGYSPTTGVKCDSSVSGNFPPGCSSNSGFSVITGQRCSDSSDFPPGCSSTSGFSSTTGKPCGNNSINPNKPYISGVKAENSSVGSIINVYGNNLNGGTINSDQSIYIDGLLQRVTILGQATDGSSLAFTPPTMLTTGRHSVQITNSMGPNIGASDVAYFSIGAYSSTQPSITVLSPNGGETLALRSTANIRWKASGNLYPYVSVYLQPEGSNTVYAIASSRAVNSLYLSSSGLYGFDWYVGDGVSATGKYRILVQNHSGTEGSSDTKDYSDSYFTITSSTTTQPSITVLSPNGGGTWNKGQTYNITWKSSGLDAVMIYALSNNGKKYTLTTGVSALTGSYSWTVPTSLDDSDYQTIKIYISDKSTYIYDSSDSYFTIASGPISKILDARSLTANVINGATNTSTTENVVGAESFHFTQFLEEGSYGNEVMELQKLLNKAGYNAGNVDGIFGPKVKEALIGFQTANGLKSDGIAGYEVRTFLNR